MLSQRWLMIYLFIFSIGFALFSCSEKTADSVPLNIVTSDSVVSIMETGQIEAVNRTVLSAPGRWRMEYRIQYMPPEGSLVQTGDTVVIFDTREALSMIDEARSSLDLFEQKLKETRKKNFLALEQKKKAVQQSMLELQSAQLFLENAVYESETKRKDAEIRLKKSKLNLERARKKIQAQRIINKKREDLVLLDRDQALGKLKQAQNTYNDMFLTTPRGGIVIYNKVGWGGNGEKIKTGDEVRPQTAVVSIPDLSRMQAVIRLNEADRPNLRTGLKAELRVAAFPDTLFEGKITFISRIVNQDRDQSQVKTYDVHVEINSKENYRLKPGLSANISLFTDTLRHVFRVPSYCLRKNGADYLVRADDREIAVKLIRLNDGYAFVRGKLKTGMELSVP